MPKGLGFLTHDLEAVGPGLRKINLGDARRLFADYDVDHERKQIGFSIPHPHQEAWVRLAKAHSTDHLDDFVRYLNPQNYAPEDYLILREELNERFMQICRNWLKYLDETLFPLLFLTLSVEHDLILAEAKESKSEALDEYLKEMFGIMRFINLVVDFIQGGASNSLPKFTHTYFHEITNVLTLGYGGVGMEDWPMLVDASQVTTQNYFDLLRGVFSEGEPVPQNIVLMDRLTEIAAPLNVQIEMIGGSDPATQIQVLPSALQAAIENLSRGASDNTFFTVVVDTRPNLDGEPCARLYLISDAPKTRLTTESFDELIAEFPKSHRGLHLTNAILVDSQAEPRRGEQCIYFNQRDSKYPFIDSDQEIFEAAGYEPDFFFEIVLDGNIVQSSNPTD
jgi:hypothetical protein